MIGIVIYIAKRKISAQCIMRKHSNKHIKSQQQGTAWGACVKECAWQLFGYLVDTQWEPSAHNWKFKNTHGSAYAYSSLAVFGKYKIYN